MLVKKLSILFFLSFSFLSIKAQDTAAVAVSCTRIGDTDTLWLKAKMNKQRKPASLMVVASAQDAGVADTMYYPLVMIENNFDLIIPEVFQNGIVTLTCYYYPSVFQISGTLHNRKISDSIMVNLLTGNSSIYNKVVEVKEGNSFVLPKLVFENKASVFFNFINTKRKVKPDISLTQFPAAADFTDSVFTATFNFGSQIVTAIQYDSLKKAGKLPAKTIIAEGKGKQLKEVIVTGTRKTKLDKFKEEYTTPLFADIMEKEYDCLTNDEILHYPDCITYLQGRTAGFVQTSNQDGEQIVLWRNEEIKAFYIDEIQADINEVKSLDVNMVAMVKLLPPAFIGASVKGRGGVIAVYTRRGEYVRQGNTDNNWIFSMKGYTPASYTLFSKKIN